MPDFVIVLLVFVLMAGALHYMLLLRWPQSVRFWHASDYAWLAIALLAVFPAVAEIDRLRASADLISAQAQARIALSTLRLYTDPTSACGEFMRSDYSPPNFDEVVASQDEVCRWAEAVRSKLPSPAEEHLPQLALPKPPTVPAPVAAEQVQRIVDAHRSYSEHRDTWNVAQGRLFRRDWEITFLLLSPFLLAGAVALRMTRVTAHVLGRTREVLGEAVSSLPPKASDADPGNTPPLSAAARMEHNER